MADKLTGKETARITTVIEVDGKTYQPNQLVKNIPEKQLAPLIELCRVSIKKEDIKYCEDELKAEVVDHTAKPTEKEAE